MDKRNSKDPERWNRRWTAAAEVKAKSRTKMAKRELAEAGMPATGVIPEIAETPTSP
jgi:hypothetical protein